MFDFVRSHQRLMQLVLLVLIVPSFVFFGVQGYERMNQNTQGVAKVAGQDITQGELDDAQRGQLNRMRQQLGPSVDVSAFDTTESRAQTLDGLIAQRVLANQARKQSLGASDTQLRDTILGIPGLQEDGRFNQDRYLSLLAQQNLTPVTFEARLRQDLAVQQLSTAIESSALVPRKVVERFVALAEQRRLVGQSVIKVSDFEPRVKLAADAVQKEYDAHPDAYMIPESVKVEYTVLSADALARQVKVPDDEARAFYDKNKARYEVPEQRRASHILVAAAKDASDADKAKAKAKAQTVLAQVRANPADFAKLAKQYSDDPGSATNGGDLDFLGRGATVPPFEDAMFALKPDAISDLVQTDFGFHIIKVTAIKPGSVKSFDAVRPEIDAELGKQLAQKKFGDTAEAFANGVYEQGDALAPTAKTYGLDVLTADNVTRAPATGLDPASPLGNAKLLAALFTPDSLKNHRNTEAIETSPGTLVSARVLDYKPAAKRPLADVADAIRTRLVGVEARKLVDEAGKARLAELRGGNAAAATFSADVPVGRLERSDLPPDAVTEIFRVDVAKLPAYAGTTLASGDYAIYRVDGVRSVPDADVTRRAGLATSIERQVGTLEFSGYLAELRQRSKVKVYPPYAEVLEKRAGKSGS